MLQLLYLKESFWVILRIDFIYVTFVTSKVLNIW